MKINEETYEIENFDKKLYVESQQAEFTSRCMEPHEAGWAELVGYGNYNKMPVKAFYFIRDNNEEFDMVDWDDALKELYLDTDELDNEDVDWSIKNGVFIRE